MPTLSKTLYNSTIFTSYQNTAKVSVTLAYGRRLFHRTGTIIGEHCFQHPATLISQNQKDIVELIPFGKKQVQSYIELSMLKSALSIATINLLEASVGLSSYLPKCRSPHFYNNSSF